MDRWPWVFLLLLGLAGCADIQQPLDGVQTAAGEVAVTRLADGTWKATQTQIGMLPFTAGQDVSASTVSGAVTVEDDGSGTARAMATFWASGQTEEEARTRLATLRFSLDGPGVEAHVRSEDGWQQRGGSLVIQLPTRVVGQLSIDTTAGLIDVNGIEAAGMDLATTSGDLRVDGKVDDLEATVTSGLIALDIDAKASGSWAATTSAGMIDLQVTESAQRGYDIRASTTAGGIEFDLDDTEVVSSQMGYAGGSHRERTHGFAERAIQTEVVLEATAGQVVARS